MISKEEFTKKLGKRIQVLRQKRKMSQEELADKADLYRTYVGHIETGRYSPSGYVLFKLIQALKVDPKEVFST